MAAPDPATTEWVPIWSPQGVIVGGGGGTDPHHLSHETGGSDQINNISGGIITSGTVNDARLSVNVAFRNQENVFTQNQGISKSVPIFGFVNTSSPANNRISRIFANNNNLYVQHTDDADNQQSYFEFNRNGSFYSPGGLGATPLNASNIVAGTLADARLSTNVPLLNKENNFGANIGIFSNIPIYTFFDTSAGVNQKRSRIYGYQGNLWLDVMTDDNVNQQGIAYLNRSGQWNVPGGLGITPLNGDSINQGRVKQQFLGSGTFNSNTFLRGDGVWASGLGIPSGLIAMFSTACPVGWTRVAGMDGRMPVGSTVWGQTGGSTQHRHSFSGLTTSPAGGHRHSFSAGFSGRTETVNNSTLVSVNRSGPDLYLFLPHDHGFAGSVSGDTSDVGDHSHSLAGGQTNDAGDYPPYVTVIFCMKD